MATGDQTDVTERLTAVLPGGWFPPVGSTGASPTPILDGVLAGISWMWSQGYALIQYTGLQSRIATATDVFLDIASNDYFGTALPRNANESDSAYRARIQGNLLRDAGTRAALIARLTALTGQTPVVFEPQRPADTGAYSVVEGISIGVLDEGNWTETTALAPPITGCTVYEHTASASGDSNVGNLWTPDAIIGETITGTCQVWIPTAYSGDYLELNIEDNGSNANIQADLSLTDQWQTLTVTKIANSTDPQATILRSEWSGSGGQTFYSSAWGWRRSESDPAPVATGLAWNAVGGWGDLGLPFQCFVTAYRPVGQGIAIIQGYYDASAPYGIGGWNTGALEYASLSDAGEQVTDVDIYAAIAAVMPAGSIAWARILPSSSGADF